MTAEAVDALAAEVLAADGWAPAPPAPPVSSGAGALPYLDLRVVFDPDAGAGEYQAHCDQRDMRRAQLAIGVDPDRDPLGFSRACAWAFLTRTGALEGMGWKDFDRDVAFVIPAEDQTAADPTGTAPAG
jgi:hypothetical protein